MGTALFVCLLVVVLFVAAVDHLKEGLWWALNE
jgi:hypothetical protein